MLLLALCCSRAALAAVSFDANKYYYIIEYTTGRYVSSSATNKEGSYGLLAASLLGEKFRFAETQGKWQITTKAGSSFGVSSTNSWNISNSETEWTIEETNESGVYTLYQTKNLEGMSRGYLNYQPTLAAFKVNSLYVNFNTSAGDATHLTKFRIVEALSSYDQPQFGGIVWTYNTSTSKFDASGKTSTATPGREGTAPNWTGPLYKFDNVGTVTTSTTYDTSDNGGIWVIGSTSNVTCHLGKWAGSILVGTEATATVSYDYHLKGTEPDASATVWTDGVLTFSGRNSFSMNDGSNQRWFIGENGAIWTSFTSVDKGTHTWDLQIVVADQPELANQTRTRTTLTKKVMTWGADLSSNINSITVWYKDANGTYTQLGANAVSYDATGITVTYTGLGYGPVERAYTLTDENGATYKGTYSASWYGNATALPTLVGAQGYTLSNVRFSNSGGTYSLTADITFPFPVSSAGVKNSTGIKSALGDGYFFHVGSGDNAGKLWCTKNTSMGTLNLETINPYRWYIYPQFNANEGKFGFTIQSVSTGQFVPTSTISGTSTSGPQLVDELSAGTFYYVPSEGNSNGFCTALSVSAGGLFLSVNSSSEDNQGVFFYNMSKTTHVGSNLSFPEPPIANALLDDVFNPLKNATRIPVTPGATIIKPKEIATPAEINAAIEAAQTLAATNNKNLPKIDFTESEQGRILSNYNAKVADHGALLSVDYTLKSEYGTICLPFNYADPASWNFYRCSGSNGNVLTLVQETDETRTGGNRWGQNTPYIVEYAGVDVPTADAPKKYQFIGYGRNAGTGVQVEGWLTGVLADNEYVPSGSYILSKYNNVLGFYQVDGNDVKVCPKYKCYLTPEASQTRAFFFTGDGEVTGIEAIFGNTEKPVIYNTAGQRLNSLQKGVNIVNGHKVLVK